MMTEWAEVRVLVKVV
jgi:hypothetical protein